MPTVRELVTKLGFKVDEKGAKEYDEKFKKLKETAIHIAETLGVVEFGKEALKAAGKAEQANIVFEQMLGSADKAKELSEALEKLAMKTGMNKEVMQDYAQQLLKMGVSGNKIGPMLRQMGELTGGNTEKMSGLVQAFGRMHQTGLVSSRVFMSMMNSGIPIMSELQKQTGLNTKQIEQLGSKGLLSFDTMQAAMDKMTGAGGKFHNLMEKEADTLPGLMNRGKETFVAIAEAVGSGLLPVLEQRLKPMLDWINDHMDQIKEVIAKVMEKISFGVGVIVDLVGVLWKLRAVLAVVVGIFLIYQAVMLGIAIVQGVLAIKTAVLTAAQWLLNTAFLGFPVLWIILGIAAIVVGIILLVTHIKQVGAFFSWLGNLIKNSVVGAFNWLWTTIMKLLNNPIIRTLGLIFLPMVTIPLLIIKNWKLVSAVIGDFIKGVVNSPLGKFLQSVFSGGKSSLSISGQPSPTKVNDAIITKTGKVIHTSPEDTIYAMKGNTRGAGGGSSVSFHIDSSVNITVPAGSSMEQQRFIKDNVDKAIHDSWQQTLRRMQNHYQRVDYSGVIP